jgi:hypothetical protein
LGKKGEKRGLDDDAKLVCDSGMFWELTQGWNASGSEIKSEAGCYKGNEESFPLF